MVASGSEWAKDILQLYFTLIPVILVFQGLELQMWLNQANGLQNEYDADPSRFAGVSGEQAKAKLRQRITSCIGSHPSALFILLFMTEIVAIIASSILGYIRYRTCTVPLVKDTDLLFLWASLFILLVVLFLGLVIPGRSKKGSLRNLLSDLPP